MAYEKSKEWSPREPQLHFIVKFGLMFSNLSNLMIVVVEDDNDIRKHLGAFLDRSDAKVMLASNALEGLEAIKNTLPDLVLCDIKMPGMDGFELLGKIRALGPDAGGSVPVIAMSAFMRGERAYILSAGFQACLPKPFTPDRLSETILAVLTTNSLRRQTPADL